MSMSAATALERCPAALRKYGLVKRAVMAAVVLAASAGIAAAIHATRIAVHYAGCAASRGDTAAMAAGLIWSKTVSQARTERNGRSAARKDGKNAVRKGARRERAEMGIRAAAIVGAAPCRAMSRPGGRKRAVGMSARVMPGRHRIA
jgi:hypothetical protein